MKALKILLPVLAILSSGCSMQNFTASVPVMPSIPHYTFSLSFNPKVYLRPDTNTVLVINKVDLIKQHLSARNLRSVKAGAYTAIKYAGEQLASLPHVHIISLPDSLTFALTTDSIANLAAKYHADYTLALTDYNAGVSLDDFYEDGVHYNHGVNVKFTMYLGDGRLYKDLAGSAILNSVQPDYGLLASIVVHPTVGGNKDKVIEATQNAVFTALLDYLPYTETESRPLYSNASLEPMVNEILAGHVNKADSLSQPFFNDKDSLVVCKVAYNMAVAYEAQGNFDKALDLAQFSVDKFKNGYATSLVTYLKSK